MKRIISLLMAVALIFVFAIPAMAASGINSNEEALLKKFNTAVDNYASVVGADTAAQYKAEAANALVQVDLDAAACKTLSKAIDDAVAVLISNGVTQKSDVKKPMVNEILGITNKAANQYGIYVSVNAVNKYSNGYATVTVDGKKVSTVGSSVVNQTGIDMTATYAVVSILLVALVAGVVIARKQKLFVRG